MQEINIIDEFDFIKIIVNSTFSRKFFKNNISDYHAIHELKQISFGKKPDFSKIFQDMIKQDDENIYLSNSIKIHKDSFFKNLCESEMYPENDCIVYDNVTCAYKIKNNIDHYFVKIFYKKKTKFNFNISKTELNIEIIKLAKIINLTHIKNNIANLFFKNKGKFTDCGRYYIAENIAGYFDINLLNEITQNIDK